MVDVGSDYLLLDSTVDREVRGRWPGREGLDETPKLCGATGSCGRGGIELPAASVVTVRGRRVSGSRACYLSLRRLPSYVARSAYPPSRPPTSRAISFQSL